MATNQLTLQGFKDKVFDFDNSKEWHFKGERPAIIDFYADWCGPCKAVAPVLEELAATYQGKVDIYKVDTEQENDLSSLFGIQSIPTLLFIPVEGTPMMQRGAIPKSAFVDVIENKLLATQEKEA